MSIKTMLWLIVGGFLVGLGGPFWYDMVNSLSSLLTLATGAKRMADNFKADNKGGTPVAPQPQTPVEHFNTSATGRDVLASGGLADGQDEPPDPGAEPPAG